MVKHDAEWFKAQTMEHQDEVDVIQKLHAEQVRHDMEELEALKNDLLWEARAKRLLTAEGWAKYLGKRLAKFT